MYLVALGVNDIVLQMSTLPFYALPNMLNVILNEEQFSIFAHVRLLS